MIQLRLKEANLFFGSRLACLRNQKCTIYLNRIITDGPQKEANDSYKALGITCPEAIPVIDGHLVYTPPKPGTILSPKRKRKNKTQEMAAKGDTVPSMDQMTVPKKRGRPKGSKNKKTLEREAMEAANGVIKRGRRRPKGSRNKKTLVREAVMVGHVTAPNRKRGRPKGSKNKKTLEREAAGSNQQ